MWILYIGFICGIELRCSSGKVPLASSSTDLSVNSVQDHHSDETPIQSNKRIIITRSDELFPTGSAEDYIRSPSADTIVHLLASPFGSMRSGSESDGSNTPNRSP